MSSLLGHALVIRYLLAFIVAFCNNLFILFNSQILAPLTHPWLECIIVQMVLHQLRLIPPTVLRHQTRLRLSHSLEPAQPRPILAARLVLSLGKSLAVVTFKCRNQLLDFPACFPLEEIFVEKLHVFDVRHQRLCLITIPAACLSGAECLRRMNTIEVLVPLMKKLILRK